MLSKTCGMVVVFLLSSTNQIDHHDRTEMLLKVALNTQNIIKLNNDTVVFYPDGSIFNIFPTSLMRFGGAFWL
jgi:hypothetical protein